MTSRRDLLSALLAQRKAADRLAAQMRSGISDGTLSRGGLESGLAEYIFAKYRISQDDISGLGRQPSLRQLAELSLKKTLRMFPEEVARETSAANCDGADSVEVKQALLLMAIQRDFEVSIDGFSAAFAEDIADLSDLIWNEIERNRDGC